MTVTGQTIRAGCSAARTPTATRTGTPTYVGISNLATFMTAFATWVRAMLRNNWIAYAGDPDDPEQYQELLRRSPTSKVDEIHTPLLVIQGAQDSRVAQGESDAIVDSLRNRDIDVEYFIAENEGHHIQNFENVVTMFGLMENHFAQHLGGRSQTAPEPRT